MTITDWLGTLANKPGRLYRKLDWLPKPLFAVINNSTGNMYDDEISSVTINRGKSDNAGGVTPATMEVQLGTNKVGKAGDIIALVINFGARNAIIAKLGGSAEDSAYIAARFRGRLGRQTMEDRGDKKLPLNTMMAASWSAQLPYSPDVHTLPSGTNIYTLLERILRPSYLAARINVSRPDATPLDSTFGDVTGKYSDLIGKFAGDIGILVRDTRSGDLEVLPMPYRREDALSRMATLPALTRSQALSPASWDQPNEQPATEYRLKYRDANNVVKTIVTSPTGAVTGTAPVEDLDWTYFRAYTDQWRYVHGLRSSGFDDRFRLETVTIDLLELLSSPHKYHWQQALYVLKMQVGDPVYLGADWPNPLKGVHFAEGITERIDLDTWEVELHLIRFRELTGDEPTGTIPARVWEQAKYPWSTETREWGQA